MSDDGLLASYDYTLPSELIAAQPALRREGSRLLALSRNSGEIQHRQFREFPSLLQPGDLLVLNETRVIPARLAGVRTATGGKWEGLFLRAANSGEWTIIGQTRGKLLPGESITIPPQTPDAPPLLLTLLRRHEGEWSVRPDRADDALTLLNRYGSVPLPPYIEREFPTEEDRKRYQTIYARRPGAVAAPTAGLHFTPEILAECEARGVSLAWLTLHVGIGTFRPITAERLSDHVMHHEWCELPPATVVAVRQARERGGRVIAVGTTSVRTLESAAAGSELQPWSGETNLFIRPPYRFRVVDALLTNFHLPKSSLLVLVSAFAGRGAVLNAYQAAIAEQYRFFSYGDAMLIA